MSEDKPQLVLIAPTEFDLEADPARVAAVLDAVPVACLRLSLASRDEDRLSRAADALREVGHSRDVPLVIDNHQALAQRLGLDGVHLTDGSRHVRAARKLLGADAIVGTFCGASRHDGLTAGEAGADYVAFGPVSGALGDGSLAEPDLFQWWSEMIEVPIVAEGGLTEERLKSLAPITDFFALGEEIWTSADPADTLRKLSSLF